MSLFASLVLAAEEHHELIAPAWVFPVIAAAVFLILGIVSWSYRDVYHRHADTDAAGEASSHQDAHH